MKVTLLTIGVVLCFIIGAFLGGMGTGYLMLVKSVQLATSIKDGNDWVPMLRAFMLFAGCKIGIFVGAMVSGIIASTPCLLLLDKENSK